jgi:hypothetical protein
MNNFRKLVRGQYYRILDHRGIDLEFRGRLAKIVDQDRYGRVSVVILGMERRGAIVVTSNSFEDEPIKEEPLPKQNCMVIKAGIKRSEEL